MWRKRKHIGRQITAISKEILALLDKSFPHGVVEIKTTTGDSYLADLLPKLNAELLTIRGAVLLYERPPDPEHSWQDDRDPSEDPPSGEELSASYHLFFLGLAGERFTFESEDVTPDEDGNRTALKGRGSLGCALALSVVAPLAMVQFAQMEQYDDGSQTIPDIDSQILDMECRPVPEEVYVESSFGSEALAALTSLRSRVISIVHDLGIALLSAADARSRSPGSRPAPTSSLATPGRTRQ